MQSSSTLSGRVIRLAVRSQSNRVKMKLIALSQGQVTKVDDADFERLNRIKWHAHRESTSKYYARASIARGCHIRMARFIMRAKPRETIDHINRDTRLEVIRINPKLSRNDHLLTVCTASRITSKTSFGRASMAT